MGVYRCAFTSTIGCGSSGTSREALGVAPVFMRCIRSIRERTFKDIGKCLQVLRNGIQSLGQIRVGTHIESSPGSSLEILRACMGVNSPSAAVGRANAMLAFLRWRTINCSPESFLPLQESRLGLCFVSASFRGTSKSSLRLHPSMSVRTFRRMHRWSYQCFQQW